MMPILKKYMFWVCSPLLLAAIMFTIVWFSEHRGAYVFLRIRLEVFIVLCGGIVSLSVLLILFIQRQFHRQKLRIQRQQQQESQREHQRFIQRLDHELKNPLTAIQLALENLQANANDTQVTLIQDVKLQATRLNQLTNDLRKLAAFDSQELVLEKVNIAELLNATKELISEHALADSRTIQIILPTAWPVANVKGDYDLLQLALYNLLENAVKYSNQGDHIDIRASDNQQSVTIEISDTGLGIAPQDVSQVCDELFRGRNSRDRVGTGIGLSLVKKIIERHEGILEISSKEGRGTRIIIMLPVFSE